METVANNPEDGQTEILFFSYTSGEVQRKLYMQLFDAHFVIKSFISKLQEECLKSTSIYSDLICSTFFVCL